MQTRPQPTGYDGNLPGGMSIQDSIRRGNALLVTTGQQNVSIGGTPGRHIGIVLPDLAGGGAERVCLTLAQFLIERGHRVDLVLLNFRGNYRAAIPDGTRLYHRPRRNSDRELLEYCRARGIGLQSLSVSALATFAARRSLRRKIPEIVFKASKVRSALGVAVYLGKARPQLLFSALTSANDASILAMELTGRRIPHVVSVRNNVGMSQNYSGTRKFAAQTLMPRADAVVAISQGVASEAIRTLGIEARRVRTIYNPTPVAEIRRLAQEETDHPWFGDGEPPVVLTALKEGPQKDWATLVTAFGQVCRSLTVRLAILGRTHSAEYREQIVSAARSLGIEERVSFLGFDENPFRYMQRAALFVHSSHWEGLGNVLIEALACGTPVVSTDSPFGPAEILENGRWGRLTPVGDVDEMAEAIIESLRGDTVPGEDLRRRAEDFSGERAVAEYEALFESLIARNADVAANAA